MIPDASRWSCKPGNWDPLRLTETYEDGDPVYGIPSLLRQALPSPLPPSLVGWSNKHRREFAQGIHFFTDDFRFECCWNKPERYAKTISACPMVLSPDFSVFHDKPRASQIWNTYRARWLARRFQDFGAVVIPAITWGDESSFEFCFLGVPDGSCVAVSSVGRKKSGCGWDDGFLEMIDQIDPEMVFVVGPSLGENLERLAEIKYYESDTLARLRRVREEQKQARRRGGRRSCASSELTLISARKEKRSWAAEEEAGEEAGERVQPKAAWSSEMEK